MVQLKFSTGSGWPSNIAGLVELVVGFIASKPLMIKVIVGERE